MYIFEEVLVEAELINKQGGVWIERSGGFSTVVSPLAPWKTDPEGLGYLPYQQCTMLSVTTNWWANVRWQPTLSRSPAAGQETRLCW
ncbi:hypothetical protein E2C01_038519 [Portunus trituberculatus]|uniref:Uncharacterized protein n=1 Tax=Portunus trituberculatus TaxID=210409 RepID=A0A5B7FI54_PORTR|nr:hypothetical protein [Portunus trituberculatus]